MFFMHRKAHFLNEEIKLALVAWAPRYYNARAHHRKVTVGARIKMQGRIGGAHKSRWAYPASQSFNDVSWHGSDEADKEMKDILEKEKMEEQRCMVVQMKPSWVRVLGQGNKFSFAKPKRSNEESEETEPSSERNMQGSGGGRTSKSLTGAIPIKHRE